SARNHDSESPEPEGSESKGSEPEDYTSFNNTHTFKGTSASQKTFTSSSKKQLFSLKRNDTLNDINKNIGSRNPREYNNEDFDPTPLNNNIEDSNYSHYRSRPQHSRSQSQRQSRSPRHSQHSNPRLSRHLHSRYSRSQSPIQLHSHYSLSRSPRHSQRSQSRSQQHSRSRSNSCKSLSFNSDYEAAAYVAE
ncbi:666_t:CDS:1, partial [Gigaspora rosea]